MQPNPDLPPLAWLLFYAVALGCIIGSLWFSVSPRGRAAGWVGVRIGLGLLIIPMVVLADGQVAERFEEPHRIWLRLAAFTVGLLASAFLLAHESWLGDRAWWQRWGRPATLTCFSLVAALLIGTRFHFVAQSPLAIRGSSPELRPTTAVGKEDEFIGVTDLGATFPLVRFSDDPAPDADPASSSLDAPEVPESYRLRAILANPNATHANSHGWVFAEGKFKVPGRYVDLILEDNGYHVVVLPKVGDLILYRDEEQVPIHTGIVKAVGQDGFVLIESKVGESETAYHLPDDHLYAPNFAFYRSTRDGHTILQWRQPVDRKDPKATPAIRNGSRTPSTRAA